MRLCKVTIEQNFHKLQLLWIVEHLARVSFSVRKGYEIPSHVVSAKHTWGHLYYRCALQCVSFSAWKGYVILSHVVSAKHAWVHLCYRCALQCRSNGHSVTSFVISLGAGRVQGCEEGRRKWHKGICSTRQLIITHAPYDHRNSKFTHYYCL